MRVPTVHARPAAGAPASAPPASAASRPLRVAMAIDAFRPVLGGAQLQIERLAPLLGHRGVRVAVLTRRLSADAPRRAREGVVDVLRLPVPRGGAGASVAYAVAGATWVAAERPDVVHAHGLLSAATLAVAGGAAGRRPVVAKVLSSGPHGDLARLRTKPGGAARLAWMARHAAAFVCVSADIEAELRAAGVDGARIVRIPNGVDVAHHRPPHTDDGPPERRRAALGLPPAGPLTITCGRLDPAKRLDHLVAAHAAVPGTLLLLGEGPERARLEAVARAAGVADRVAFRPTVDDPAPYLRAADAYVTCSAQDGLSNAVLEAMATGLPVVAAAAGGMRDLVDDDTGALVPADRPGDVGHATAALLADPARVARLGAAARARVERDYALDATADRLAALYRRVAS